MKVTPLELEGLLHVELDMHRDGRGFFVERYNEQAYREAGLPTQFVQDNHSRSTLGVLRGLHYQTNPGQGKLVGATRGKIYDVALDIRPDSPSFGKWAGVELDSERGNLLWVPSGFAHGFCVLGEEDADVMYKVTALYSRENEGGVFPLDPEIGVKWPLESPQLSQRDQGLPKFSEYRQNPVKDFS